MDDAIDWEQMERVARRIAPQAELLAAWPLRGGISAQMTALELALPQGHTHKVIVRRPGDRALQLSPHAAASEYAVLHAVAALGVKAQKPLLLDSSGDIFPEPYLVVEYVEGETDFCPVDVESAVRQMAGQLARLHQVDGKRPELASLPHHFARLDAWVQARPAQVDDSLDEGRIRDALLAAWPLPPPARPALLHGDFWPGNLLWRKGELVAVIDWEDAEVGNPLADFAISRLDTLWIYGPEAMHIFSTEYVQLAAPTPVDFAQLPYWDLLAALRPASRLSEWAAGWAELGRSDITEATMRSAHHAFVERAFAQLDTRP